MINGSTEIKNFGRFVGLIKGYYIFKPYKSKYKSEPLLYVKVSAIKPGMLYRK